MKSKGQAQFTVFLVPIIAVILLGIIWTTVRTATAPTSVTNEAFTSVNDTYVALTYDDMVAVSAVRNINGTVLTETTHYVVDLTGGRINITTAGQAINGTSDYTCYADYTYKADSYMDSSTSRMVIGYLPVIFAVALLVFITGFIALKRKS